MRMRLSSVLVLAIGLLLMPATANAAEREPRGSISIEWNGEFDRAHGVRSGSGTMEDPYIISGWDLDTISIRDTTKAFVIRDNTISGKLKLNYVGHHVVVTGNDIADLRVNQNIPRWGDPTAGRIVNNDIDVVGQIRHYDGLFAENTIGSLDALDRAPDTRAVNLDGFNGGVFRDNTIFGTMDARLHGHHHGSSFDGGSHHHEGGDAHMDEDHTTRYHRGTIVGNRIATSAPVALRYLDTNHAANDRTANSEVHPMLNAPHVHRTKIKLVNNQLVGGGLQVNVFNARDDRHLRLGHGTLVIRRNTVSLADDALDPRTALNGIEVRQARALHLKIEGNEVTGTTPVLDEPLVRSLTVKGSGIVLDTLDDAMVIIDDNAVTDRKVGVRAARLTARVDWTVTNLRTSGVEQRIATDGSVKNEPNTG